MTNTIQIGQQFKINAPGYGKKMILTVTRIDRQGFHYTSENCDGGVINHSAMDYYFEMERVTILPHRACGCFYVNNEINTPCAEHVERVLSAIEELEVETMFAGEFN